MADGGTLGPVVLSFIQKECQKAQALDEEACQNKVAQKTAKQIDILCQLRAPYDKVPANVCARQLGSSLWKDPSELEKGLMRKMPNLLQALRGPFPLWAGNGTKHRGIKSLIETEAKETSRKIEPGEENHPSNRDILWSEFLKTLHPYILEYPKKWHKGKWPILFHNSEGGPFQRDWYFHLTPNRDKTFTLKIRLDSPVSSLETYAEFSKEDFPRLKLSLLGKWEEEKPLRLKIRLEKD